ncbi:leucine-rich repeat protein, partial [Clostridium butyricum]
AFEACSNLSKVKLSNKLETIGENAFRDCKLQSVNTFNDRLCFSVQSF